MKREIRSFKFNMEARNDEATDRVVRGYAAVFRTPSEPLWGEWREQIQPGAFAESLVAERDIYALWQHDPAQPIASRDAKSLKLEEDDNGLRVEVRFGDSDLEKFWYSKIADGTIRRMSFGFATIEERQDYEAKMRTLVKVKLYEVSPVTWPAYGGTSISARGFDSAESVFSQFVPVPPTDPAAAQIIDVRLRLLQLREREKRAVA